MTNPTPEDAAHPVGSTARETLARVLMSVKLGFASMGRMPAETYSDAILAHLTSDEAIERAAKRLFEDPLVSGDYSWAEMVREDPTRADIWRADARAVVLAALGEVE